MKNFNIFDFTDKKNGLRAANINLQGVYNKGGFQVATDAHVMAMVKADYDPCFEKKLVDQSNAVLDGFFPEYEKVIPKKAELKKSCLTLQDFKNMARKTKAKSVIKVSDRKLKVSTIKKVIKFWSFFPDAKLFENKNPNNALMVKSGENLMLFMPLFETTDADFFYDEKSKELTSL